MGKEKNLVEKDSPIFRNTKIVQNKDCHLAYLKLESGSWENPKYNLFEKFARQNSFYTDFVKPF